MIDGVTQFLKTPDWRKQHGWRKSVWNTMSRLGLTGLHGLPLNRRWVDIQHRRMPLPNLDPSCKGLKLVQISDLHYSPVVWERYLLQFISWVNDLKPDVVVTSWSTTKKASAEIEGKGYPLFSVEPRSFEEIIASLRKLGAER